jgi:hypothetical protein
MIEASQGLLTRGERGGRRFQLQPPRLAVQATFESVALPPAAGARTPVALRE